MFGPYVRECAAFDGKRVRPCEPEDKQLRPRAVEKRSTSVSVRTFAVTLAVLLWVSSASAQSDFSGLATKPGDYIHITDPSGVEVSGRVSRVSPLALAIDKYEFKPQPGLKIERPGDSLWNGALIGLAVGGGLAAMVAGLADCMAVECTKGAALLGPVVVYGALGAFIDWRHTGRTVIYEGLAVAQPSVRIAPEVTPHRKALSVSLSF
jgi:hypothetical protein